MRFERVFGERRMNDEFQIVAFEDHRRVGNEVMNEFNSSFPSKKVKTLRRRCFEYAKT